MAALVAVAGPINAGALAAIPVPIILAAGWVYAAERCGLVATDEGIESRMTRRENTFRCRWTDIDSFELIGNGAQIAIVMQLCDGSRKLLPSTRAWFWDKRMGHTDPGGPDEGASCRQSARDEIAATVALVREQQ